MEQAALNLRDNFANASRFKFDGGRDTFSLKCSWTTPANARIIRASNTGYEVDAFVDDSVFVAFNMQGFVGAETGDDRMSAVPRSSAIALRPGRTYRFTMADGALIFGLQLTTESLMRQASLIFDETIRMDDGSQFSDSVDITSGSGAALFRNVAAAFKEIEMLEHAGLGMVAEASLAELLTNLAVISLVPGARALLEKTPRSPGTGAIERARQYIEAHAEGPVRIAEVARDLGISMRTLQVAFQRQLGRTPTEYLFECRLAKVRQLLLNAPGGATVTALATECGFANLGAFSARYRNAFGEFPSETLSRRRRGAT